MGTEREFADMIAFINEKQIVPIIDEVFPLDDVELAFQKMDSGKQFGKIVFEISN